MAVKLNVTLVRSLIGSKQDQRSTVRSLGLRKMHQRVEVEDSAIVRGMLHKIRHLVRVDEVE